MQGNYEGGDIDPVAERIRATGILYSADLRSPTVSEAVRAQRIQAFVDARPESNFEKDI